MTVMNQDRLAIVSKQRHRFISALLNFTSWTSFIVTSCYVCSGNFCTRKCDAGIFVLYFIFFYFIFHFVHACFANGLCTNDLLFRRVFV